MSTDADGSQSFSSAYPRANTPLLVKSFIKVTSPWISWRSITQLPATKSGFECCKNLPVGEGEEGWLACLTTLQCLTQTTEITTGNQSNQANILNAIANISAGHGISSGMQMYYSEFGKLQLQFSDNYAGHEMLSNILPLANIFPDHMEMSEVNSASMRVLAMNWPT